MNYNIVFNTTLVIHVFCVIFWTGATYFQFFFLMPALSSLDNDLDLKVIQALDKYKLHIAITSSAIMVFITGELMFSISPGYENFFSSFYTIKGALLHIGAASWVVMVFLAWVILLPNLSKFKKIRQLEQGENKSSIDIKKLVEKIKLIALVEVIFSFIAIITMVLSARF
jgi:uncharacterized membrane protein